MMHNKQEEPPSIQMCYTRAMMWMSPENTVQRARSQSQEATDYESLPSKGQKRGLCRERKMKEWVKGFLLS